MVSIFPNPCLWRRSLRSNLGSIDLEKLYRATLKRRATAVLACQVFRGARLSSLLKRAPLKTPAWEATALLNSILKS